MNSLKHAISTLWQVWELQRRRLYADSHGRKFVVVDDDFDNGLELESYLSCNRKYEFAGVIIMQNNNTDKTIVTKVV